MTRLILNFFAIFAARVFCPRIKGWKGWNKFSKDNLVSKRWVFPQGVIKILSAVVPDVLLVNVVWVWVVAVCVLDVLSSNTKSIVPTTFTVSSMSPNPINLVLPPCGKLLDEETVVLPEETLLY